MSGSPGVLRRDLVGLRPATHADVEALVAIRSTPDVWSRWRGDDLDAEIREAVDDDELHLLVIEDASSATVGAIQWAAETDPEYHHVSVDSTVTGMAAGVRHLPPTASAEDIYEVLLSDGAVVVDDLGDPSVLARVRSEMAPYIEATPFGSDRFAGRNTRRTGALIARSAASRELIQHPLVLDVTGHLLARATNYQLHLTQIIAIGPGEPAQAVHRDQWAFDFFPFASDHHVQCNTIWALTDFTEANGATRIIPGSQDWPDSQEHTPDETVPAEMSAGSCLFYTGKVYHGGGANTTDEVRIAGNITYVVGWLRQEENQYLSVPREVAETLDDDLLRLMGYRTGAYALGYIDDVRDPLDALRGGDGRSMSFGDLERTGQLR